MLSYPGLIRFGDGVSIEVFPLIARLRRAIVPRQGKAFERNSKGIE